jgi:hypothetical protein
MSFQQVERLCGSMCWLHETKPVFVVEYSATNVRGRHFQAYRAVEKVPKGRNPWTVDNRRIGNESGFQTLEEAQTAANEVMA